MVLYSSMTSYGLIGVLIMGASPYQKPYPSFLLILIFNPPIFIPALAIFNPPIFNPTLAIFNPHRKSLVAAEAEMGSAERRRTDHQALH